MQQTAIWSLLCVTSYLEGQWGLEPRVSCTDAETAPISALPGVCLVLRYPAQVSCTVAARTSSLWMTWWKLSGNSCKKCPGTARMTRALGLSVSACTTLYACRCQGNGVDGQRRRMEYKREGRSEGCKSFLPTDCVLSTHVGLNRRTRETARCYWTPPSSCRR